MRCPSCARTVAEDDQFCRSCGAALVGGEATGTPAPPAGLVPVGPAVTGWAPTPPPARRGLGAGLLALVLALLLVVGGGSILLVRRTAAGAGGGSPEAAVDGLAAALAGKDLRAAAGYLHGEERDLLGTYADRLARLAAAGRLPAVGRPPAGGNPLAGLALSARDLVTRRVGGGGDVAVLELTGGTIDATGAGGLSVHLPVAEANQRVRAQTRGAVPAIRVVTIRSGGRWYVSLLGTAGEYARLAGGAGPVDYGRLADGPAGPGAGSPQAAVEALAASAATSTPATLAQQLAPDERRVYATYADALLRAASRRPGERGALAGALQPPLAGTRITGLATRTTAIGPGVAKVEVTGGRLEATGKARARFGTGPIDLATAADGQRPYLIVLQRGGTWYPSLLFTAADHLIAHAEREHP